MWLGFWNFGFGWGRKVIKGLEEGICWDGAGREEKRGFGMNDGERSI